MLQKDCRFFLGTWKMRGVLAEDRPIRTLREVLDRLRDAYCGTTGYEVKSLPSLQLSLQPPPPPLWGARELLEAWKLVRQRDLL